MSLGEPPAGIAPAAEVLGQRWTLLILDRLLAGGTRFNALSRGLPRLSRPLLSKRLHELERAGIVEHRGPEYLLTGVGWELEPAIAALRSWCRRWRADGGAPVPWGGDAERASS